MIVIESISYLGLTVTNLENSIKFYRDLFDFEVIENNSNQAFIKEGDIIISLNEAEKYKSQEESKNRVSFIVDEDDFEDAVDELNEKNIPIVSGPENIRKGRSVVFLDPDGNQIELCYPKLKM
ncbi:MAG: VOC family protein [Spirochaetes bacterium]|nr:VOC family protein [Spirochaetota bacterium]